jgi:hypothetical protein
MKEGVDLNRFHPRQAHIIKASREAERAPFGTEIDLGDDA